MAETFGWEVILGNGAGLKECDLIDFKAKQWRSDLVKEVFWEDEANEILAMLLPRPEMDDKLIWHFTTSGVYSVKSGYEVALNLKRNGMLGNRGAGESSHRDEDSPNRKDLWAAPTPGKIKHSIWKCFHDIVSVKDVLFRRKIVAEPMCPVCWEELESLLLLFSRCKFAQAVWKFSPLGDSLNLIRMIKGKLAIHRDIEVIVEDIRRLACDFQVCEFTSAGSSE